MPTLTEAVTGYEAQLNELVEVFTAANSDASDSADIAIAQAQIAVDKAAEALASLNDLKGRYYGALGSDPLLDPLGNAVGVGDAYFSIPLQYLKIYNGTTWDRFAAEATAVAALNAAVAAVEAARTAGLLSIAAAIAGVTGINNRGAWAPATAYALKDIVLTGGVWYICVVEHTSSAAFATDTASKWRVYQGVIKADLDSAIAAVPGGLGDYSVDDHLMLFSGDSTTEGMGGNGYGFDTITKRRQPGEKWGKVRGTINFGGSGHQMADWVNGALAALPVYSTSNLGAGQNDYYGHKTTGATSLATSLAWRAANGGEKVTWVVCYGINDCILNASVGNLSLSAIAAFITGYLEQAVARIHAAYPRDRIVLRIPNPMTARPYLPASGFPSAAAYPAFGAVLGDDQALVEKWNQGLRAGYIAARNRLPGTLLFDSWELVFGRSDTTLTVSQLPNMLDLVHPNGGGLGVGGYNGIAEELVTLLAGSSRGSPSRSNEAERRAVVLGVNAWDVYPGYFRDNVRYKLLAECTFQGAGTTYLDLNILYADFNQQVSGPIFIVVADRVAQYFANYTKAASGNNTRLTVVVPSAAMQAGVAGQKCQIYASNLIALVANDAYVNTLAVAAREYIDCGTVSNGGAGYIDLRFPAAVGHPSTKFLSGIKNGVLVVGGTIGATLALSAATGIALSGAIAGRSFRVSIAGTYTTYAGQPCAITFTDSVPGPKAFEYVPTKTAVIAHAVGSKGWVCADLDMAEGATLTALNNVAVGTATTVDVYHVTGGVRTLLGTITIPINNTGAVAMAAGNPAALVPAGRVYEFVVTSSTTSPWPIRCQLVPV
jgi:lysophospholipase L1-like esterase